MTFIGCLFDDPRVVEETIGTKEFDFVTTSGKGKVVVLADFVLEKIRNPVRIGIFQWILSSVLAPKVNFFLRKYGLSIWIAIAIAFIDQLHIVGIVGNHSNGIGWFLTREIIVVNNFKLLRFTLFGCNEDNAICGS
ncbi:hypothetical protein D3C73_408450 [compost metagenome]